MTDITKIDDDETADNEGVDRLSAAMKKKLKAKRLEGRGGWHNDCPVFRLKRMFNEHLNKGDVLDLANFAMMIWNRENPNATVALPEASFASLAGWKLVPETPTPHQIAMAIGAIGMARLCSDEYQAIYAAMLQGAPLPPSPHRSAT